MPFIFHSRDGLYYISFIFQASSMNLVCGKSPG
jgi:hypothetical protein